MADLTNDKLTTAARRLARALLKDTPYCPEIEFIGVRSNRTGCANIATHEGFDIRIDAIRGSQEPLDAETLVARTYHAAAHMLCIQFNVSSHSGSGRHTNAFQRGLDALGAPPEGFKLSDLTKTQQAAAVDFARTLSIAESKRPARTKSAYARTTLVCPAEECTHTLTLRDSAIAKTRFLCVEHGEEMLS